MKLYSENDSYKLYNGNMLDMLEVIEPNTIDSIVTDPPYGLTSITKRFGKENSAECQYGKDGSFARLSKGFMGKEWDGSGIEYNIDTWQKCYEVLKPGGYLLAFGGSRTFHRIACAIEDAGFEIRDTIMWIYGSGFPKSMDISKQIDKKPQANKTIEFKKWLKIKLDNCEKTYKQINDECGFTATSYSKTDFKDNWSTNHPSKEKWLKMKEVIGIIENDYDWICENNVEERGFIEPTGGLAGGSGYTVGCYTGKQLSNNAIDNKAKKWQGWGTALKPSFEPIIVARKPFKGSLVDNIIENGVGGINIDECRVGNETISIHNAPKGTFAGGEYGRGSDTESYRDSVGRFPANTILTYDETDFDEVCGGFPYTSGGNRVNTTAIRQSDKNSGYGFDVNTRSEYADSGSASRYFMNCKYTGKDEEFRRYIYTPKASKKDRDEGLDEFEVKGAKELLNREENSDGASWNGKYSSGNAYAGSGAPKKNTHPTVKPTELMQYLVRLVSPNGATILDPFNGSGSTGKAVMYENKERDKGYKYIGIELTEEYLPIAKARIEYVCNLPVKEKQTDIFDFVGDSNE